MTDVNENLEAAEVETEEVAPEEVQQQAAESQPDYDKRLAGLEAALTEERRLRQQHQQELAYLRGAAETIQRPQGQPQKPKPIVTEDDFWNDIPGTFGKVYAQVKAEAMQEAMQHFNAVQVQKQVNAVMRKHSDYLEAEQAYLQAANMHPGLYAELQHSANPAEHVYSWFEAQKSGTTTDALQKRIAELEAQISGKAVKPPPKTQAGGRQAGPSSAGDGDDPWADRPL